MEQDTELSSKFRLRLHPKKSGSGAATLNKTTVEDRYEPSTIHNSEGDASYIIGTVVVKVLFYQNLGHYRRD